MLFSKPLVLATMGLTVVDVPCLPGRLLLGRVPAGEGLRGESPMSRHRPTGYRGHRGLPLPLCCPSVCVSTEALITSPNQGKNVPLGWSQRQLIVLFIYWRSGSPPPPILAVSLLCTLPAFSAKPAARWAERCTVLRVN